MISVVILSRNEEKNILDCIESIGKNWEVLVIDDYSEDRTIEVLKSLKRKNTKILRRRLENDFSTQRNFGMSEVKGEWILFLDPDERITPELRNEIEKVSQNDDADGYRIQRKDIMWGKVLNYGETGNIRPLRFVRKGKGKWKGKVHERLVVDGEVKDAKTFMFHYPHPTVSEFLRELNFYSTIRANELYKEKVRVGFSEIILYPKAKFLLNYFVKLGFLDGVPGLMMALFMSFHSFLVRGKLWQLQKK